MNAVPLSSSQGLSVPSQQSAEVGDKRPRSPEPEERNVKTRLKAPCEERIEQLMAEHQRNLLNGRTSLAKAQSRRVMSYLEKEDSYKAKIAVLEQELENNRAQIVQLKQQLNTLQSEISALRLQHETDRAQIGLPGLVPEKNNREALETLSREQLIMLCEQNNEWNQQLKAKIKEMELSQRKLDQELKNNKRIITSLKLRLHAAEVPMNIPLKVPFPLVPVVDRKLADRLKVSEGEALLVLNSLAAAQPRLMAVSASSTLVQGEVSGNLDDTGTNIQ